MATDPWRNKPKLAAVLPPSVLGSIKPMMDKFVSEKRFARIFSVSLPTVRRWRASGEGPYFTKVGSTVRYRLSDIFEWAAEHRKQSTSE